LLCLSQPIYNPLYEQPDTVPHKIARKGLHGACLYNDEPAGILLRLTKTAGKNTMAEKSRRSQEQPEVHGRSVDNPHPALKLRHTLRGHDHNVYKMALTPDGRILASPSQDTTVRLWDMQSGWLVRTLDLEHQGAVDCVAWSPDGTRLATGANDEGTYRVYRSCGRDGIGTPTSVVCT
jgi:WD40 repeat protein